MKARNSRLMFGTPHSKGVSSQLTTLILVPLSSNTSLKIIKLNIFSDVSQLQKSPCKTSPKRYTAALSEFSSSTIPTMEKRQR